MITSTTTSFDVVSLGRLLKLLNAFETYAGQKKAPKSPAYCLN